MTNASTWTLMAILYGGGAKGADLDGILSAGDYLNHAIIPYDELRDALIWLRASGCIETRDGIFSPTPSVLSAFQEIGKKYRAATKRWDALDQFLAVKNSVRSSPPKTDPEIMLSRAQYELTLRSYLARNGTTQA